MKRIFVLTLFFLISLSNFNLAYSISPDVFIQSTVNRASQVLSENISKDEKINYSHLINWAGLRADEVAHKFQDGLNYKLLPFKGLYWEVKKDSKIDIKTNLYPVPDLNVPFLGVHFTPSADAEPVINVGPTATPALGRENYYDLQNIEPLSAASNLFCLLNQYVKNEGGFRKYVHQQSLLFLKPLNSK